MWVFIFLGAGSIYVERPVAESRKENILHLFSLEKEIRQQMIENTHLCFIVHCSMIKLDYEVYNWTTQSFLKLCGSCLVILISKNSLRHEEVVLESSLFNEGKLVVMSSEFHYQLQAWNYPLVL